MTPPRPLLPPRLPRPAPAGKNAAIEVRVAVLRETWSGSDADLEFKAAEMRTADRAAKSLGGALSHAPRAPAAGTRRAGLMTTP